ncbi:MAG: hypothetical protein ACOC8S_05270, partial [Bacteroidota bacterium]
IRVSRTPEDKNLMAALCSFSIKEITLPASIDKKMILAVIIVNVRNIRLFYELVVLRKRISGLPGAFNFRQLPGG